jgi:SecD/SecF fusion protein
LPRTVNPGRGAAFVLGGETLTDFGLALLTGLVVGTYSSMFTATPLAIELHKRT